MRKCVYDASWYFIKSCLNYKVRRLAGEYIEISETYTTQDCSNCGNRSGPKGSKDLNIKSWTCSGCKVEHDRDINAARNILNKCKFEFQTVSGMIRHKGSF